MTIRNFNYLFNPNAIALVCGGGGIDAVIARNLMQSGFQGPVMPVDTSRPALEGAITYPNVASLPLTPELAVLTAPLQDTSALLAQLGKQGVRAAVIVNSSGKIVPPSAREALHQALRDAAAPHLLRVLGPGCMDLKVPAAGLNASLSQFQALTGHAAFVTQSTGIAQAAMDWGVHQGFGFSYLINLGAEIDVDVADALDYLANDYKTRAILLYLEHITSPRKFMSAARRAARIKPVIVLKPNRHDSREQGEDAVYSAAFRRAGILRVDDRHELFNLVEALPAAKLVQNDRLAIIGNSRSLNLLAASTLYQWGGRLAQFAEETQRELENLLDSGNASANPVDLGSQANAERYGAVLDLVLKDRGIDGVLVIKAPSALSDPVAVAEVITARLPSRCCLLASFPGPASGEMARRCTMAKQIPTYETSNGAVRAFMRMVQYKRNQRLLMETPPSLPEAFDSQPDQAKAIIAHALAAGRAALNEYEAMQLLACYGIPGVATYVAKDADEAACIAADLGRAVAIKILSQDIPNKFQVGGVARYLDSPEAVRAAAKAMVVRMGNIAPAAQLEGFLVQPIEHRDGAYEMTLGVRPGGPFGPVLFFGQGGTEAEVIDDIGYGLPPLNMHLAREMMAQTRIYGRLRYSLLRRADLNALALTLVKVSQMVIDLGELVELDINPLRVSAQGVLTLDAQVRIAPWEQGDPARRLAIRPYPSELEEPISLSNGRQLLLRPVLPEDEPALQGLVQRTSPEDLRLRFFQPIRALSHDMAAALTQIDYNREMALVAVDAGLPGQASVYGLVNLSADPNNEKAEYSIIIDRELMRLGLGIRLMRRIIDYARQRGIREIYGEVLGENDAMLQLDKALGFEVKTMPDDPGLRHVTLRL